MGLVLKLQLKEIVIINLGDKIKGESPNKYEYKDCLS